jgi:hypothetical protein
MNKSLFLHDAMEMFGTHASCNETLANCYKNMITLKCKYNSEIHRIINQILKDLEPPWWVDVLG